MKWLGLQLPSGTWSNFGNGYRDNGTIRQKESSSLILCLTIEQISPGHFSCLSYYNFSFLLLVAKLKYYNYNHKYSIILLIMVRSLNLFDFLLSCLICGLPQWFSGKEFASQCSRRRFCTLLNWNWGLGLWVLMLRKLQPGFNIWYEHQRVSNAKNQNTVFSFIWAKVVN